MSEHLRHEEVVDALDDPLVADRQAHLDGCEICQAEVASLRDVLREARGVDIAEPSPLFWDHFSERVRKATADEPWPQRESWWNVWWRPVGTVAAVAGAVAFMLVLRPARPAVPSVVDSGVPMASLSDSVDDGSWGLVVGLASELDVKDVGEAARPAAGTADAMIDELSATQRSALAKLLQQGMGDLQ